MSMYDRDWYRELIREEREQAQRQEQGKRQGQARRREGATVTGSLAIFVCPALTLASVALSLRVFVGDPLPSMVAVAVNACAFVMVGRERTRGHKGITSAAALVVSMLGFSFSFVLAFFLLYARLGA